jgi:signal transduction histidine kinase
VIGMRSLVVKLTLAFLLVGLTGAFLVAMFVRYRTQDEFGRLVFNQNEQVLVTLLTKYYEQYGSWNDVDNVFHVSQQFIGGEQPPESRRELFIIADPSGNVVYGHNPIRSGAALSTKNLKQGSPIKVDGKTVGWLIFLPTLDRWQPGTLEGNFLFNVTRAATYSAIVATGIALIIGSILAFSLTRSLREMTAATELLAKGQLGHQVKVRSKDEIGKLATSFNLMSKELAHSTELRRQMTANIAHDLRSPLTVIMGYFEALSDGKLEPSQDIFNVMHTETMHLSRLIDDLKTLSLADARDLPLIFQNISPTRLLQRTADAHRVQADQKGINLALESSPDLPEIKVDIERMIQVLGNLMNNALRFTPDGGKITLRAFRSGDQEIRLQAADTGSGIPAEDVPFIFERSFRGDKARRQIDGETGLGLAIAKSLVEAQGGKIQVESAVGQGTTFTIILPIAQA